LFGLVSFGTVLGEPAAVGDVVGEYTEDVERILGYGYRSVYRARPDVTVTDLACGAAELALADAGIEATELDLVVVGLTDIADYLYWDAAASVQHRIGATRAEAVQVTQACTAALSGLELAAGRMATREGCTTALVLGANRCCDAYWNRMQTQSMVFSDGAAATVLRRGHDELRWRASHSVTDGRYADFYRMDVGGAARPFPTAGPDEPVRARDAWDIMEFFDYDETAFAGFATQIDERARGVVDRACQRAGTTRKALRRVFALHDNRRAATSLVTALDLEPGVVDVELGLSTGHLGAADQLFALQNAHDRGELDPGDLVALVGLGRGMHWACTVLEA
jgi:3-oxoacyl-[acyl-carrier-protein] synthase-3